MYRTEHRQKECLWKLLTAKWNSLKRGSSRAKFTIETYTPMGEPNEGFKARVEGGWKTTSTPRCHTNKEVFRVSLWCRETRQSLGRIIRKGGNPLIALHPLLLSGKPTHREIFSESCWITSKSDCIYHFPIDLDPNKPLFGSKSIGKW